MSLKSSMKEKSEKSARSAIHIPHPTRATVYGKRNLFAIIATITAIERSAIALSVDKRKLFIFLEKQVLYSFVIKMQIF